MMIDLNIVRREAERVVARRAHGVRVGVVSSYDPATHSVKMTMQPEGYQTGWVPIATMGIGKGFGVFCGPNTGDSVIVAYHESDKKTPIVIGRLPTNEETPVSAESGEFVAQSAFDSFLKLLKDGTAEIQDKGGASVKLDGEGNITATGKAGQTVVLNDQGGVIATDKSGAKMTLDGSGNVTLAASAGQSVSMDASGTLYLVTRHGSKMGFDAAGNFSANGAGGQSIGFDASGNIVLAPGIGGKIKLGGEMASIPIARNGDAVTGAHVVATSTEVVSL